MVRTVGFEPTFPGWKPDALPLNYARALADGVRFELTRPFDLPR